MPINGDKSIMIDNGLVAFIVLSAIGQFLSIKPITKNATAKRIVKIKIII